MPAILDLTDETFGKIVIVCPTGRRAAGGRLWQARCDTSIGGCGREFQVFASVPQYGMEYSCGCCEGPVLQEYVGPSRPVPPPKKVERRERREPISKHPLYGVWANMLRRCNDPKLPGFLWYGGRGIKVCERWSTVDGFQNFVADMGERPSGLTSAGRAEWWLERVDNDGDYEPRNCKWATAQEQAQNRRLRPRAK